MRPLCALDGLYTGARTSLSRTRTSTMSLVSNVDPLATMYELQSVLPSKSTTSLSNRTLTASSDSEVLQKRSSSKPERRSRVPGYKSARLDREGTPMNEKHKPEKRLGDPHFLRLCWYVEMHGFLQPVLNLFGKESQFGERENPQGCGRSEATDASYNPR